VFQNSLFITLKNLRGNVRGCVFTEPLWGIPYNLYAPYVSVYMLALGMNDAQIGLITSIGLVFQVLWALLSGAITDKLGRKRTTLITDLITWSVPTIIWAVSQNFTYFLVAAIINAGWRVSANSWQCLLVEDTEPSILVEVYSWIYISGLLAAFVAPFGGLLIARYQLVATMRGLFVLAFVMMTAKFLIMNGLVTETKQGVVRMRETRDQPLFHVLGESKDVLGQVLRSPIILIGTGLMLVISISQMVRGTFWSILVVEKLHFPAEHLAIFYSLRSIVMMIFFFVVMPRLRRFDVRKPMLLGFILLLLSQIMLVMIPRQSYVLLTINTVLEACAFPLASTLLDTLMVVIVDAQERARIMAILYVAVIVLTSPFGWIAGQMSELNRALPFMLNVALYAIGGLLTWWALRQAHGNAESDTLSENGAAA
jgi:DHA1 family tetracycline resistance protein-like MFS transporter